MRIANVAGRATLIDAGGRDGEGEFATAEAELGVPAPAPRLVFAGLNHVPADIVAVPAIPHTRTGEKLKMPVRQIFLGADPARVVGHDAVDNPAALDAFIALADALRKENGDG
jgi:hypothetical protein